VWCQALRNLGDEPVCSGAECGTGPLIILALVLEVVSTVLVDVDVVGVFVVVAGLLRELSSSSVSVGTVSKLLNPQRDFLCDCFVPLSERVLQVCSMNSPLLSFTSHSERRAVYSSLLSFFQNIAPDSHILRSASKSGSALDTVLRFLKGMRGGQPSIATE